MGTRIHASLWLDGPDAEARAQTLLDRALAEMHRIDRVFSPYRDDSELSRLNREAPLGWVTVSDEMFDLLERAARVSGWTDGAFDITYASVGRYYDYRAGRLPTPEERAAVEAIDHRHVELDPQLRRVRYRHAATYVDLGGIAKGHAVDRAADALLAAGISNGSVTAGGDSRIIGDRRGKPWSVGVRDPRNEEAMTVVIPLVDAAVSTSGDYERFFELDGTRYHHILDPQTGESARQSMSVTILGADATLTDALSTAVFVLGPERGLEFVNQLPDVDAIVIDASGSLQFSDSLESLTD